LSSIRPIRVCHVVSDDAWGGAESVIRSLLEAQQGSDDVEPSLVTLNDGRLGAFARARGIPTTVVPETGRSFLSLLRDAVREIAALRPGIVHSHRYKENFIAWIAAPRCGARSVVTLHGEEPPVSPRERIYVGIRRAIARRLASRVGARFATVARDLPPLLGLAPSQWVVIPNGIALPLLARPSGEGRPAGWKPTIGWVGRMVPVKGLPLLLQAMTLLPDGLREARLLLVGDGPQRAAVEALAVRLGIADRVELRGFVADPSAERGQMDVFALPSVYEGVPVALLEAMGAGLPCVASAVGGIPDAVGESGAVRLVSSREPAVWAKALSDVLLDPGAAASLGGRARSYVAAHLSAAAAARAYGNLYRGVLASSVSG